MRPEARSVNNLVSRPREERRLTPGAELRADAGNRRLTGYAAVFGQVAVIGSLFRETIAPGAFSRAIRERQDVIADLNHWRESAFARVAAGTLTLAEDGRGLFCDAVLNPRDPDVQRLLAKVESRTFTGMSFAFLPAAGGEVWDHAGAKEGLLPLRTLTDVNLFDVAVVTDPQYTGTSVDVRTAAEIVAGALGGRHGFAGSGQGEVLLGELERRLEETRLELQERTLEALDPGGVETYRVRRALAELEAGRRRLERLRG